MASDVPDDDDDLTEDDRAGLSPGLDTQHEVGGQVMEKLFGPGEATQRRFGRYEVVRRLGQGAMGTVYLARDPDLDREVAIKVMRAELASRERTTLVLEAKAMARLNHPNVVAVYDVGEEDDRIFVAMEKIDGVTLREWAKTPRPWAEVAATYRDAARGLAAAHEAGVIHRDLKPDNILVGEDGRVTVVDFGLAQMSETSRERVAMSIGPESAGELTDSELEGAMQSLDGTPAYMAPEVIRGDSSDATSDQFSLCVSLYESLCGQRPFVASSMTELLVKITTGDREPRPEKIKAPGALWAVIERGLQGDPSKRYSSMTDVATALGRSLVPIGRRLLVPALVGALVGSAAVGAYAYGQLQDSRCQQEGTRIDEVWTPDVRTTIGEALTTTELPYAEVTRQHVDVQLDQWAQTWRDGRGRACATRAEDGWAARRSQCYDGQLVRLNGLLEVLSTSTPEVVERALDAVSALPSPARCEDDQWLSTGVLPPPDSEQEQEVGRIREQLARAASLRDTGQFDLGLEVAQEQLQRAEELDYRPLLAEGLLIAGRLQESMARYDEALEAFDRAFLIATEIDAPLIATGASIRLADIHAARLSRPREGLMWARLPEGYLARLGDGAGSLAIYRLKLLARIRAELGEPQLALTLIESAHVLAAARLAPESSVITSVIGEKAWIHSMLGNFERSIELSREAVERSESRLGPAHPSLEPLLTNLMIGLAQAERFDEAHPIALRVVELNELLNGPRHPETAEAKANYGALLTVMGELDAAVLVLEQAYALEEELLGATHISTLNVIGNLTELELRRNDYEHALVYADTLVNSFRTEGLLDHPRYPEALEFRITALEHLERRADAAPTRLELAKLWWDADKQAEGYGQALEAKKNATGPLLQQIDRWLREHPVVPQNAEDQP